MDGGTIRKMVSLKWRWRGDAVKSITTESGKFNIDLEGFDESTVWYILKNVDSILAATKMTITSEATFCLLCGFRHLLQKK